MKKSVMKTIISALVSELEFTRSCEKASNVHIKYLEEENEKLQRQCKQYEIDAKIKEDIINKQADDYRKLQNSLVKQKAPLTEDQMSFMLDPARYLSRKIEMIKYVRSCTGLGLKEAKEFVEAHISDFKRFADRVGIIVASDKETGDSIFSRVSDSAFNDPR